MKLEEWMKRVLKRQEREQKEKEPND